MTIPAIVNTILKELIAGIVPIKEGLITGLYLTGSIPLGDYHPGKSDNDFLVLCKELPDSKPGCNYRQFTKRLKKPINTQTFKPEWYLPDD